MSFGGLSLRDLEYLDAVARHRHFGRAAMECGVSQPSLSAQIRKVEAIVGVALFERSPRRVLVTHAGEEVLIHARAILREAHALLRQRRNAGGSFTGPLRIGALPTLGPYLLPRLIGPLRKEYPDLSLVITEDLTERLVAGLRAGQLDAILLCRQEEEAGLAFEHIFFEPFLLLHSSRRPAVWPPDGGGAPVILLREGHCLSDQVQEVCGSGACYCARHAQSLEMLRYMVSEEEGLSLVPALAARALNRQDGLVGCCPLRDPAIGRDVVLAWRKSERGSLPLATLAELMRSAVNHEAPGAGPSM